MYALLYCFKMIRFIIFLVFNMFCIQAITQDTYSRRYHLNFSEAIFAGIELLDDNFFVSSVVVDSLSPFREGSSIALFDESGNLSWSKASVYTSKDHATWSNVLKYYDQHLYALGYSFDPAMKALLIKYNLAGEVVWEREVTSFIQPDAFYRFNDLFINNDKLYITGDNVVYEGLPYDGAAIFVVYNTEGEVLMEHDYGEPIWSDHSECIVSLNDSILILGGSREKTYMQDKDFDYQTQLIAVDTMGEVLWQWRSPEDQLQQGAQSMVATPDGGLIVVTALGTEEFINAESTYIAWDCYIFKLNSDLEEEWGTVVADGIPNPLHKLMKVIPVSDGSGYLAVGIQGVTYTDGDINEENAADIGGYLVKISPEGEKLWTRVIIHPDLPTFIEYHELYDVAETTDGGFLAVGRSVDLSGTEEVPSQGWLLKVDEYGCLVPGCHLVSSAEDPRELPQLLLYPNPVEDVLNVYLGPWTNEKEVTFRIVDVQGKVWQKRRATVADATYLLAVNQLSAGAYFLQLIDVSGQVLNSKQFIKP